MKNLRYSSLHNKKKTFYRNLGTIPTSRKSLKTLELIARKSYEALPAKLKRYIDNPDAYIEMTARMAKYELGGMDIYKALEQAAKGNPRYKWSERREVVWAAFRTQCPRLYSTYLSYMRRRGISGTQFWYDNVEFDNYGSRVETYLDLNVNTGYDMDRAVIFYGQLFISFDFSGNSIINAYLN